MTRRTSHRPRTLAPPPPSRAWRPNCRVSERRTPQLGCRGYEHPAVCREMTLVRASSATAAATARRIVSARAQRQHQWSSGVCLTDTRPPAAAAATPASPAPLGRSDKTVANRPDFWSVLLISSSIYSDRGSARCCCCWCSSKSTFSAVYFNVAVSTHTHQSTANWTQKEAVLRQLIERAVWTSRPVRRLRSITVDYSWLIIG